MFLPARALLRRPPRRPFRARPRQPPGGWPLPPKQPLSEIRERHEVDVEDLVGEGADFREARLAGATAQANLGAGGAGAFEDRIGKIFDVDAVPLDAREDVSEDAHA